MAAHRFWRLFHEASNSGNISASHIEFHSVVGGPNICIGGVGTASSTYSGFDADAVWAGTEAYASAGGAPQWNQYDLGAGVTSDVVEVAWTVRTDGYSAQSPSISKLQYSDDGASFTDASADIDWGPWSVGETQTVAITPPVPPPALADSRASEYLVTGPNPGVFDSRMSQYAVEGPAPGLFDSRMSQYAVEGPNKTALVSRVSQYVVIGAPVATKRLGVAVF